MEAGGTPAGGGAGQGERDGEYRAASDRLLESLHRLRSVEQMKRLTDVGAPEFVRLAHEAEELARLVLRWSVVQRELAQQAPAGRARGEVSGQPIAKVQTRPIDQILAQWREAEMLLADAAQGSEEAEHLGAEVARLRDEYHAAHARATLRGT